MKILFVAKHGSGDNDDEGAVGFALEQLGHEVVRVHEKRRHRDQRQQDALERGQFDLCLFFKHEVVSEIAHVAKRTPCAFYYFDMVRSVSNDPSLSPRSESRIRWMNDVLPHCVAGFATDGDWCAEWNARHKDNRMVWLMQGADERVAGKGVANDPNAAPILFTGMKHHGRDRANHIDHLERRWGKKFSMLGDGGPRRRVHGRELANLFASTKVIVAPNGPSTGRYWSNRVFLTLGFGGFLLHPYCEGLTRFYGPDELLMYRSIEDCDSLIAKYLDDPDARMRLQVAGYDRTMRDHLYRHRVAELVKTISERI